MRYYDYGDNPELPAPSMFSESVQELLEGADMPQNLIDQITAIIDRWEEEKEEKEALKEYQEEHKVELEADRLQKIQESEYLVVEYGLKLDTETKIWNRSIELRQSPNGFVWFISGNRLSVPFGTITGAEQWATKIHGIDNFEMTKTQTPPPPAPETILYYGMEKVQEFYYPRITLRSTPTGLVWYGYMTGDRLAVETFATLDDAFNYALKTFRIGIFAKSTDIDEATREANKKGIPF